MNNVYCIGIGGIGLSALARYYAYRGAKVSGSDDHDSMLCEMLRKEGIAVELGRNAERVTDDIGLCIYTIAVQQDHPELVKARALGIRTLTYPEALGELTKTKTTIAICGTHGKTTTTAMTYHALKACGINPTLIVGSLLQGDQARLGVGSNFIPGESEYLVVEACEYRRSFLNLEPKHILLTNIDEDHLDYYKDRADIDNAFQTFIDKLPEGGVCIAHEDMTLVPKTGKKVNADVIDRASIKLSVLGEHNQSNAQLVLMLGKELNLPEEKLREGLLQFTGTWRRLEYKGIWHDIVMYDDYGHHPTEIKATLAALRTKYTHDKYKVIAVFQPHLFSRTKEHLDEFAESFFDADTVCIMPIYAAREKDDGSITSEDLVEKTHNAMYMESFDEIKNYVLGKPRHNTVLITIGAGDVNRFHEVLEGVVH